MSLGAHNSSRWGSVFSGLVERSLRTSQALARDNANAPAALRPHLESMLNQVEWGYRLDPALSAALLLQLDPWPARWGLLDLWSTQLERALHRLPTHHPLTSQLSAALADVYCQLGRLEEARQIASELLNDENLAPGNYADLVFRCGGVWVSTLLRLGQMEQARQVSQQLSARLEAAAARISSLQLVNARAVLALQSALIARHQGRHSTAIEIMNSAIRDVAAAQGFDRYFLSDLLENRAVFYWAQSQYQAALDDLQTIQTKYITAEDALLMASLHGNRGLIYWGMHRFSDAEAELHQAIAFTEKSKAIYLLMKQVGNLGIICMSRGDLPNALTYIARQLELAEIVNDDHEKLMAHCNQAITLAFAGHPNLALPELLAAIQNYEKQARTEPLACACLDLATCYYFLGERALSATTAQKAFDLIEKNDYAQLRVIALRGQALNREPAAAREMLQQALSLARENDRRLDEAGCLLWLAHLTLDTLQREAHWQAGVQILTDIGAEQWAQGKSAGDPVFVPLFM